MIIGIVYARVSGREQAKEGTSLPEQLRKGEEKAEELGCDQVIPLSDPAEAGDDIDRPGLLKARELARAGGVTYFVCLDPDRFSRDLLIQLLVTRELEDAGVQLVFLDFRYETTPEGQLFYNMKGSISQFEHSNIRRRTMRGALARAKQGRIPRGLPNIYGHRPDGQGNLRVVESEALVVRHMYQRCIDGSGNAMIAKELNGQGFPAPSGAHWYSNTVRRIIQNERMAGKFWYNRHQTSRKKRGKPSVYQLRPQEEWVLIRVPPIVDEQTWQEAQRAQAIRKPSRPSRFYLLSGLLKCGYCGRNLRGQTVVQRGRKYYVCIGRYGEGATWTGCKGRHHPAEKLEGDVWARVEQWLENEELWRREAATRETGGPQADTQGLESELSGLQGERGRLLDALQKGAVTLDLIEDRLTDLNKRIERIEKTLHNEGRERVRIPGDAGAMIAKARDLMHTGEEGRRMVLRFMLDEVIVWDDAIRIVARLLY